MDVKFISTQRTLVDTVPIVDGQVIASKDSNDLFYDMKQSRKRVGASMWKPIKDDQIGTGFSMTDASVGVFEFRPNGGSDVVLQSDLNRPNFAVGKVGEAVEFGSMPQTTRSGYKFLGWFEDQSCQGNAVQAFPATYASGKTIYYASWLKL